MDSCNFRLYGTNMVYIHCNNPDCTGTHIADIRHILSQKKYAFDCETCGKHCEIPTAAIQSAYARQKFTKK